MNWTSCPDGSNDLMVQIQSLSHYRKVTIRKEPHRINCHVKYSDILQPLWRSIYFRRLCFLSRKQGLTAPNPKFEHSSSKSAYLENRFPLDRREKSSRWRIYYWHLIRNIKLLTKVLMKQSFEDYDSYDRAVSVSISQMLIMKYTDIICNIGSIFRNVIKDQKRIKNTFLLITINRLYKNLNEINFCNCFIIAN